MHARVIIHTFSLYYQHGVCSRTLPRLCAFLPTSVRHRRSVAHQNCSQRAISPEVAEAREHNSELSTDLW